MRSLLDVNVLIALLDPDHSLHRPAMQWFDDHARDGWASCPITQNGCIRIMSHPGYPNALPVPALIARLRDATADRVHEFWADDISLLDAAVVDADRIHGPRQLTDLYLLSLAVRRQARFVTFDASIGVEAVRGATRQSVIRL